MGDLVTQSEAGREIAPATSGNVLAMVLEAARDPAIDAGKVEAMANLAMRMQDREREAEFNKAKIAAIMEMPSIGRNGAILNKNGGVQSRYSKWEDLHRTIMPILKSHGLVISHEIGHSGQMVTVRPVLAHVNGHVEKGGEMLLPIDTTGSKNGTQGAGSASSYGQRFTTIKMLNIITHDEDDDGQSAGGGSGDPYERLTGHERNLVDKGRSMAGEGMELYAAWFKELSTEERGFLAFNKAGNGQSWHDQNKELASKI